MKQRVHATGEREARVRAVIHSRWLRELRRARNRFWLAAAAVVALVLILAFALRWLAPGTR